MSLATRCTACGTVFRVVHDQLKVSEGWVRCGRCKEVFNALENLFDLEREAPPEWHPPSGPAGAPRLDRPAEPGTPDEPALHFPSIEDVSPTPVAEPPAPFADEVAEAQAAPSWATVSPPAPQDDLEAPPDEAAAQPASDEPPAFLRESPQPRTPKAVLLRRAGVGATAALALLLVLQAGHHFRDAIAAESPVLRPLVVQGCAVFGCRIEAPRRIDDIAVESSSLTRAEPDSANAEAMRLSVVLRNRGTVALTMPTIDLSLTDSSGALVARRALPASEFRGGGGTLPPAAETTLQLLMSTEGRPVSGYTVEIFYP